MIRGHRRIANVLLERYPATGPWSHRDFFLEFDAAECFGKTATLDVWATRSGRSRGWVGRRILEYAGAASDLARADGRRIGEERAGNGRYFPNGGADLTPAADEERAKNGRRTGEAHPYTDIRIQNTEGKHLPNKPRKKKIPTPPPENLTAEQMVTIRGWCDRTFPDQLPRLEHHVGACLDHFRAKGVARADWPATARNWIRRSDEWQKERNADRKDFDPKHSVIDASASLLEEWKKRGIA